MSSVNTLVVYDTVACCSLRATGLGQRRLYKILHERTACVGRQNDYHRTISL